MFYAILNPKVENYAIEMEKHMSMNEQGKENAISVRDVTKVYRLYDKPIDRLKESVSISHKNYHRDFYALKGLSFQVKKGETVGIIGTNGSGKSTILKIITGVLTPTSGQVDVDGKISALLELGAGFNMDYTGIENVYMNGTMMGYTKKEMDAKTKLCEAAEKLAEEPDVISAFHQLQDLHQEYLKSALLILSLTNHLCIMSFKI